MSANGIDVNGAVVRPVKVVVFSVAINRGVSTTDISEPQANPQSVMVGEKIDLKATVTPNSLQTTLQSTSTPKLWNTGSGDVVKGYNIAAALPATPEGAATQKTALAATDSMNASVGYYYTNGAFGGQDVTVSFNSTLKDALVAATVKFKVFRPRIATATEGGAQVSSFVGNFGTDVPENDPYVRLAWNANGKRVLLPGKLADPYGFGWAASVETPLGRGAGEIAYIQLIDELHTRELADGTDKRILTSNGKYVLDDGTLNALYGADGNRSTTIGNGATASRGLNDSPETEVLPTENMTRRDIFALYLMYKPGGADSIWTTVGVLNWSWSGYITKHADGTPADIGGVPTKGGGTVRGGESFALPTWSDTIITLSNKGFNPVLVPAP